MEVPESKWGGYSIFLKCRNEKKCIEKCFKKSFTLPIMTFSLQLAQYSVLRDSLIDQVLMRKRDNELNT
jgi:hypothetical protein